MSDPYDSSYFPTSDEAGGASGWNPLEASTAASVPAPEAGEMVGRYRLIERLGEGGFGVVWRAEQVEPVRRSVAVKLIKPGMDSRAVLGRFEAERQALAVMDHPCIARVFDGGATARGYPYFVMELVRGEPITAFCDRQRLTIEQRVELFIRVFEAVQHAHMKGVVHRDLKPANVLVTMSAEGRPEPKVIDFGIAKALSDRVDDRSLVTQQGQLVGTPAYMSPEQADPAGLDIDTRTDVYALGVMLYEILTGTLPFDRRKLREAAMVEVQRLILEVDPPKPSTRVASLATSNRSHTADEEDILHITEARRVEVGTLRSVLRRDLDWVVMKCIEKERGRRYATPAEAAADLRRFLNDEPVLAGPPSTAYRFSKLVRRHRLAFALGGAMALVLIVATFVSIAFAIYAQQQSELARTAQERAEESSLAERERAEQLDRVARFQSNMIAGLQPDVMGRELLRRVARESEAAMRRRHEPDAATRLAELDRLLAGANGTNVATAVLDEFLLKRAENAINEQFGKEPLMRARLLETVADALADLGLHERALAVYRQALAEREVEQGPSHSETLVTQSNIANVLADMSRIDEALPLYERALAGLRDQLGPESPYTLTAMLNLAACYRSAGRYDESLALYESGVPLHEKVHGPDAPDTLLMRNNQAVLYQTLDRVEDALRLHQSVLEARIRVLGPDHIETLRSMSNTALAHEAAGNLDEAIDLYQRALRGVRAALGDEHPFTLQLLSNLSVSLYTVGRIDEAVAAVSEAAEASRRVLGDEHPDTLLALGNLGAMLEAQGKIEEALPYYREALEVRTRLLGPRDPKRLVALANMSYLLESLGRLEESLELGQEALRIRREVLGNEHTDTISSMSNVGAVLRALGRLDQAEALGAEAVATARRTLPEGHWITGAMLVQHGRTLQAMKRHAEALVELEEARRLLVGALGEDHPRVALVDKDIAEAKAALLP
ncbi:MAG: serine/threonine protein kinase [Leptolyngbya sp. PLA3]|nr:MAG: serine/threonine protein kinase [Cyanobacteria bacterium CYA]MCE7968022.1 serine/threonine protein kinase [Leptolyngbya sp. PL-A3]